MSERLTSGMLVRSSAIRGFRDWPARRNSSWVIDTPLGCPREAGIRTGARGSAHTGRRCPHRPGSCHAPCRCWAGNGGQLDAAPPPATRQPPGVQPPGRRPWTTHRPWPSPTPPGGRPQPRDLTIARRSPPYHPDWAVSMVRSVLGHPAQLPASPSLSGQPATIRSDTSYISYRPLITRTTPANDTTSDDFRPRTFNLCSAPRRQEEGPAAAGPPAAAERRAVPAPRRPGAG